MQLTTAAAAVLPPASEQNIIQHQNPNYYYFRILSTPTTASSLEAANCTTNLHPLRHKTKSVQIQYADPQTHNKQKPNAAAGRAGQPLTIHEIFYSAEEYRGRHGKSEYRFFEHRAPYQSGFPRGKVTKSITSVCRSHRHMKRASEHHHHHRGAANTTDTPKK